MKSRAAILWDVHTPWSVEDTELDAPRHREVLVKLASSGLCHSDYHHVTGDMPSNFPLVGGHEGAGVVVEVGPGVDRLKVGDHVVMAFVPACGHCRWCASGMSNVCDHTQWIAEGLPITDHKARIHARGQDVAATCFLGTFAPYLVAHEDSCIKIDDEIPLTLASLVGCGVTTGFGAAVRRAQVQPGDTVVVVGAGGIGSSAVQGARIAGAEIIVAVDPFEFRQKQSMLLGATHAVSSMEEAFPLVQELTRGVMADRAILATSLMTGDMLLPLMELVRKGGRACLTAVSQPSLQNVDLNVLHFVLYQKELVGNVFGGSNPHADLPKMLSLYKRGVLKLDELVTRTYALDEINEGYDDMINGRNMRGLIVFDN